MGGDRRQWVRLGLNGLEPEGAESEGGLVLIFQPESSLDDVVADLKDGDIESLP